MELNACGRTHTGENVLLPRRDVGNAEKSLQTVNEKLLLQYRDKLVEAEKYVSTLRRLTA